MGMSISSVASEGPGRPPEKEGAYPQAAGSGPSRWGRNALLLLFFIVLPFGAYRDTFWAPWHLDDVNNILKNPDVHLETLDGPGLMRALSSRVAGWRPVAYLSFALNHRWGGDRVFSYHLVNYLILCCTGFLLYRSMTHLLRAAHPEPSAAGWTCGVSLAAASVWVVHPLHTQSVTYIVQRMNLLAGMFGLLAFLVWLRARACVEAWARAAGYGGAGVAFLLALGSKENAAALPAFVVLYALLFPSGASPTRDACAGRRVSTRLLAVAVLCALGVAGYLVTRWGIPWILDSYADKPFTLAERLLTQPRVILHYIGLILLPLPRRMNLDYDFPVSRGWLDPPDTLPCIIGLAALGLAAVAAARRSPVVSFCLLWFLGNLVIESSVLGLEMVFEHRTFLPSMGLIAACVYGLAWMGRRFLPRPSGRWVGVGLASGIVILLSHWTHERNRVWQDARCLWEDVVSKSPGKARPHSALGLALQQEGRVFEAMEQYQIAALLDPYYAEAHNNLALLLDEHGFPEASMGALKRAIRLRPDHPAAYVNLGGILSRQGRYGEALGYLRQGVERNPRDPVAWTNLGVAYRGLGDMRNAEACYREAIAIDAACVAAWDGLGVLLARTDRWDEAESVFHEALRRQPCHARSLNDQGNLLAMRGRDPEALASFSRAISCDPRLWEAYVNRGTLRYRQGRLQEAVTDYERALPNRPGDTRLLALLAATLAEAGACDEAVPHYRRILEIRGDDVNAHFGIGMCQTRGGAWTREARAHLEAAVSGGLDPAREARARQVLESWGRGLTTP